MSSFGDPFKQSPCLNGADQDSKNQSEGGGDDGKEPISTAVHPLDDPSH